MSIRKICRKLRRAYGPVKLRQHAPVLDELIATILSQNTSDTNSHAAFEELQRRFPDWNAVRCAHVAQIASAVRSAGLANRKAPRIKAILQEIHREHGVLDLEFLRSQSTDEAMDYLLHFDGIGPKTAACVLLFACGKPVLPVDTHVHRVSRRLGLIGEKTNAEKAHQELGRLVPKDCVLEFHIQLIRHGRATCSARAPRCRECILLGDCPAKEKERIMRLRM